MRHRSSASHFAYSYPFLGLSFVCPSHSCALLRPFDGFACHLAGTLVGTVQGQDASSQGVPDLSEEREICGSNPQPKHAIAHWCPWWIERKQFRLIANDLLTCAINYLSSTTNDFTSGRIKSQMPICLQPVSSNSLHVWFQSEVLGVGGSNGSGWGFQYRQPMHEE